MTRSGSPLIRILWLRVLWIALGVAVPAQTLYSDDGGTTPPPKRNKFQKSKLTYDESEGVSDKRHLLLSTGEDKVVDLDFEVNGGANGITPGNPQIVATTLAKVGEKRQIIFKPLKAGETNVTIRDADGTIRLIFAVRVAGSNLLRMSWEIRNLLRDVEGLDIRIVGPKVVIEGEVLVPNDYGRLLTVIQDDTYAKNVINMATLSPLAMQVMAKKIQEDINAFAPNVKTRVVNGMIFLEGPVDNIDQAKRAASVASLYLPELRPGSMLEKDGTVLRLAPRSLIQNFIVINPAPAKKQEKLVRLTVHFVELSKDYDKVFGFEWQPSFTADPQITVGQGQNGSTGAQGASLSGTIASLLPKLQSAQTAGYARILEIGTVVVRSGQQAKLTEETQFPFVMSSGNGNLTTGSTPVGLAVVATAQIVGKSEDIQLDLDLKQTNLVGRPPTTTGSQVVTSKHEVKTNIYIRSNESAAVAGITASDIGTDFNKDGPENATDPLFTLIHSKAYRKKKSQFVIFITPQIIENASEGTEDLKRNFRVKVK